MDKILILSEFFPPCNLTPAERMYSFAKYFRQFGFYPVIITRNWDVPIKHVIDEHIHTGTEVRIEKFIDYEVHYLPFHPTIRNKFFINASKSKRHWYLYKIIAFIYSIGENFSSTFTPYQSLYMHSKKLIAADQKIKWLLVSATPFHLFRFGYRLHKEFKINWIADYRDDWNTNELETKTLPRKILSAVAIRKEKKWVSTAKFFTTVSEHYVNKIESLLRTTPGFTILNGYIGENYKLIPQRPDQQTLQITYVGSLYATQPIEIFLGAIKKLIKQDSSLKLRINFLGIMRQPDAFERVFNQVKGFENYFYFTSRISKDDVIAIQAQSHILLASAHKNIKGTPGSKLYEFIALQKPILVCPSDNDIIEESLTDTGQGFFANTEEECYNLLKKFYSEFESTSTITNTKFRTERIQAYSRKEQVKKLSDIIKMFDSNENLSQHKEVSNPYDH